MNKAANERTQITKLSMKKTIIAIFLISISISISTLMAEESSSEPQSVYIVYVDRPDGEDPEAFHIRTLASVLGSEEVAKDAVIYHYKHAASGFSARLTKKQVEDLSKQPGVIQVTPERTLQLHQPARVGRMGLA